MAYGTIYTQLAIDYGLYETWFSPIYFSFVTLTTLGYGDAVPISLAAQVVVSLQAVTGYMGLGGLLSILGNKMARRAE
ncbi:MAG: two pore domain potassium channel family protein [Desulfobacter sp.]|nr:two pore domain potassium channel family protein [Desulfobacter sp.]